MSVRYTVERILRDPEDESGQSVRCWQIQAEGAHLTLRRNDDSPAFLLIRVADLDVLRCDLDQIAALLERAE